MSERVKSLIFAGVEPVLLGAQDDGHLPLHVTVSPSFEHYATDSDQIDEQLKGYAQEVAAFEVIGAGEAWFGLAGEHKVRKLMASQSLAMVHWDLLPVVHSFDSEIDLRFFAFRHSPHVTEKSGNSLAEGEVRQVSALYRAQKPLGQRGMRDVVACYRLGGTTTGSRNGSVAQIIE